MSPKLQYDAKIILDNGDIFYGFFFGRKKEVICEFVFNTAVCGYQEALTDPSYSKQGIVMTFPLIGIYGTNYKDMESSAIQASCLVVENLETDYSNNHATQSLSKFLFSHDIPGIHGLDTRALTKVLREKGSMKGILTFIDSDKKECLQKISKFNFHNHVSELKYEKKNQSTNNKKNLVVFDFGCKDNIFNYLENLGYKLLFLSHKTKYAELKKLKFDGIFLSNGPGDPEDLGSFVIELKKMIAANERIVGICLGHQLISLALNLKIKKLKFGHHSINHPVVEISTKKILITSQNHNYYTDDQKLPKEIEVIYRSINDNTIEGIRHTKKPIMSVQFHPEANPGPYDSEYIFNQFHKVLKGEYEN